MFTRKKYIISLIVIATVVVAATIINAILPEESRVEWLWIVLVASAGYIFIKYKVSGPLQMFATRFTMLVDYDLDIDKAVQLAKEYMDNAPTANVKELYHVYYGMGLYYSGSYEEAIKTFNTIDLRRLNTLYHVLIFAFSSYCAFEINDMETFQQGLDRVKSLKSRVSPKYQNFVASYEEILEALSQIDVSLDNFKDVIDRHFLRNDGYITTQLIYQYRLALYYEKIGDDLECDKCLAFVIANGKSHHTALQAKKKFKGLVSVYDYVIKPEAEAEEILPQEDVSQIESIEISQDEPQEETEEEAKNDD